MKRQTEIEKAVQTWASQHPQPDEPALRTGFGILTPRQMAAAIQGKTGAGKLLLRMIQQTAAKSSLQEVMATLEGPTVTRSR